MRGNAEIIEFLNEHLTAELTIINQYFLDSRMLQNWGLPGLASLFHDRSIAEMNDSVELIDRLLFLEGHPNLQRLDTVRIGDTPREMIELALESELEAIARLQRGIELAVASHDGGTRELLAGMIRDEEKHVDEFEAQLEAIRMVGIENYLARYTTPEST